MLGGLDTNNALFMSFLKTLPIWIIAPKTILILLWCLESFLFHNYIDVPKANTVLYDKKAPNTIQIEEN